MKRIVALSGCRGDYWRKQKEALYPAYSNSRFLDLNMHFAPEDLKNVQLLIAYRLNEAQLQYANALKHIIVPYTGINNFPIDTIRTMNIAMLNSHGNAPYVAEHGIAMLMALMGRIIEFHNDLGRGYWHRSGLYQDYWYSLRERRVSILGTGHIGREIARILKVFSCSIMGLRLSSNALLPDFDYITQDIHRAVEYGEIVFVCLPLTPDTESIFNQDMLSNMKGKFIINLGRGKIIEQGALHDALKKGILAGAAIDAWYNYPSRERKEPLMPSDFPICSMPNAVCSPHAASHTQRAEHADINETVFNIKQILDNNIKKNIVDLNTLY